MTVGRMQAETCVFHSDRELFKTAVRDLQRSGIIRRAQAPSVPMAVCSCRKKATFRQNLATDQIWNAADHVITELDERLSKLTTTTNDLITSSANIARREHSVTSYARFVVVISQALLGDVTLVSEEQRRSPKTRTSRPTHRLALNIVRRIIDKKKQRCPVQTMFCLPLFGGMTSALFRQRQIGFNFSRLCVSHACVLEMDSAATAQYMRLNKQTTVVSAWFSDTKIIDVVRRKLTACSLAVKKAHNQRPRPAKRYRNWLSDDFASLDESLGCMLEGKTFVKRMRYVTSRNGSCSSLTPDPMHVEGPHLTLPGHVASESIQKECEFNFGGWTIRRGLDAILAGILVKFSWPTRLGLAKDAGLIESCERCYNLQQSASQDFIPHACYAEAIRKSDLKSILRGNFQQKDTGRERENRRLATNAPKPITRKDGSTYTDGHCLYCLIPFTLRESVCQESSSCRHHPGYINKGTWTCCGEVAASSQPTHGDHSKDGCAMGRHLWRPHKTKARGYKAQKPKMYCKYFRQYKTRM